MTAIDSTGLQALESLADQVHESGRELILCGAREQPSRIMHQAELQHHIGPENMCNSIAEALNRARAVYPKAAKHHPVGTVWGRRSTDDVSRLSGRLPWRGSALPRCCCT